MTTRSTGIPEIVAALEAGGKELESILFERGWEKRVLPITKTELDEAFELAILARGTEEGSRYTLVKEALRGAKRRLVPLAELAEKYAVATEHHATRPDVLRYAVETLRILNETWRQLGIKMSFNFVLRDSFAVREAYFHLIRLE